VFPFNLSGPQFLAFYAACAIVVLLVTRAIRRRAEDGEPLKLAFDDPCAIAFLRGGAAEAIRVAAFSLLDRGLLRLDQGKLHARSAAEIQFARRPIERALLTRFQVPGDAKDIAGDAALARHCSAYQAELEKRRMLPDEQQRAARSRMMWIAIGVLCLLALVRIAQAVAVGRGNIWFLVALAVLAAVLAAAGTRTRLTRLGDRTLADLRTLFGGLRRRRTQLTPGGASNEAALLAAVFGLAALPPAFAEIRSALGPAPSGDGGSSGGDSGGSSGCGGGGDGGGGGCGGCGGD
jgi:uncharacterized protein (TIGR04222 family)